MMTLDVGRVEVVVVFFPLLYRSSTNDTSSLGYYAKDKIVQSTSE